MKLAAKLTVVFLVLSIVPLGLVGYLAFVDGRHAIDQVVINRMVTTTQLKEAEFSMWLDDSQSDLQSLAIQPGFQQQAAVLASQEATSPEYQAAYDQLLHERFLPFQTLHDSILDFFLIRASDGLILVSTNEELEGKYRERAAFFIEGRKAPYVGNVEYEVTMDQQIMHISMPVRDQSGTVIAVLAGHLNLDDISAIMMRRSGLRNTEETYLVNTFNFMVTASLFEPESSLKITVYTQGVNDCLAGNNGNGYYDDYRGVSVIGAYQWIPERQLCIVTEIDQSEALAPIVDLRDSILSLGVVVSLIVMMAGVFFGRTITMPVQRLVKGTQEISQGHLDYRVGTGARDEIGQLSRAFDQMTESLKTTTVSRDEFEQRVVERTAQLEASNKELEAFSYSVSHDLRAPLRAMDGFSRILLEEYASELPDEAQRYLGLVRENAQQMGNLIDHLLTFSRLGRQQLKKQRVIPRDLIQNVVDELIAAQEEQDIAITIGELPPCWADPTLLRQVFANLLGNAVKFSKNRNPAKIEIGSQNDSGKRVYFVKDNGVGFDMQYSNKLFGVFQRLHRAEEYEGTGVGLATVQRIIHRHGGRIWVESEVDNGTTFFFTVEGENPS